MTHRNSPRSTLAARLLMVIALALPNCSHAGGSSPNSVWPPASINQVPFVNGALVVPNRFPAGPNNRGVITDQTLPGMTHIECYMEWPRMEPEKDKWDTAEFDEMLALSKQYGLKMEALPSLCFAPKWLEVSSSFTPVQDCITGNTTNYFSPWAPSSYQAFDHFYSFLASRYRGQIDILKFPIEVGLLVPKSTGGLADHKGLWCGDRFARADFHERMLAKYGSLDRVNRSWNTHFSRSRDIDFPDQEKRLHEQRRWVDFLTWYQDSETRGMVRWLKVIRKYFPNEPIDIPLGNGEDVQTDGVDRTAVAVAAAAFAPIGIRSTHAGFNRNLYPQAYWFYKRMAPMAHSSGESFGTEPPGGDFTYSETQRAVFEAACAGANLIYQYYQNYHKTPAPGMTPHIIDDYKAALRPYELPLVDIGILFPTSQMMLDLGAHPDGQLQFCASGRSYFDYDLVDENMIEWNQLNRYKVLLQTSGTIFRDSTFPAVNTWLTKGGFLVTKGLPRWHDLDGNEKQSLVWLRHEDTAASDNLARTGASGVHVFHVGKGTIYAIDAPDMPAYLSAVVPVLSSLSSVTPLHGFKPVDDGTWMTEFPDGKLVCDSKTYATKFVPAR